MSLVSPTRRMLVTLCVLAGAEFLPGNARAATACEQLAALSLLNARIDAAIPIQAGDYTPTGAAALQTGLPAFCRVHGVASPVSGSTIGFELWLPQQGWNGKLEMFGNGGYSSALEYPNMGAQLARGYATLGTDTGHTGNDPDFAVGHKEAIVDWGNRAVHVSAVQAKAIVHAFYDAQPTHSYFAGCSTGGHQAFMEAQRYPADFDGIIAGDPGHNRTHLNMGFLWEFLRDHPDGKNNEPLLPASKLPMVTAAAVCPRVLPSPGPIHLVVDSTGLELFGQGEWNAVKHGRTRRNWRKLHLAVDAGTGEIAAHVLTDGSADDAMQVPLLLRDVEGHIASVTADGANDGDPAYQAVAARQRQSPPDLIIPPRASAVLSTDNPDAQSPRDRHIRLMAERGRIGWQRATGYGRRNHAETAMGRYKHLIGPRLRARTLSGQQGEVAIGVSVLNRMIQTGKPVCVRA